MDPRVVKIYPLAVSRRLVDNLNNYDGQVSMPFLIKMCFTKKQQVYYNLLLLHDCSVVKIKAYRGDIHNEVH